MTVSSVRAEVERLLVQLLRAKLAIATQAVIVRSDAGAKTVTWGGGRGPAIVLDKPLATIAEYRRCVGDGQYSCILCDGSLLQISITIDRDSVVKHRMLYFPCPLVFDHNDLFVPGELPFGEFFEVLLHDEFDPTGGTHLADVAIGDGRLRLRSPLRFDYDIEATREGHPASHLHLADEAVRWAMFGPLSIGHFVRFVFRHYYPSAWNKYAFLRDWPLQFGARCVSIIEERELFIDCRAEMGRQDVA